MSITFTVFFDDPFWAGLFESRDEGTVKYARVVFGKEPTDAEVYQYLLNNFTRLKFTESLPAAEERKPVKNPKRRQREANRELHNDTGVKKSWEAARLATEQGQKKKKREDKKALKEEQNNLKLRLKQEKRKEKHRGR